MTDTGRAQPVHRLCTGRAPLACAAMVFLATPALSETAWEMFVARCLDPYENLALAIHDGLDPQPAEQMRAGASVFGPSEGGFVLTLEALPEDGERACGVETARESRGDVKAFAEWRAEAVLGGRYVEAEDGALLSGEWIEPRLRLEVRQDARGARYHVLETELES